jgi:hypothetical protein
VIAPSHSHSHPARVVAPRTITADAIVLRTARVSLRTQTSRAASYAYKRPRLVHFLPTRPSLVHTMRVAIVLAALAALALAHPWEKDTPARRALIVEACPAACAVNCPDCCKSITCPDLCCVRGLAPSMRLNADCDIVRGSNDEGARSVYGGRVICMKTVLRSPKHTRKQA